MSRSQAYAYIQDLMGTKEHQSHIAMFNVEQCQRMIALLTKNPVSESQ